MPEDALEAHDDRVEDLMERWKIPRDEAQRLAENLDHE